MQELQSKIGNATHLLEMLSHQKRLHILCILFDGECSVSGLVEQVQISQPAMSHHLSKLRASGLVQTRREAQTIYYSLGGKEVSAVLEVLHELYCSETEPAE